MVIRCSTTGRSWRKARRDIPNGRATCFGARTESMKKKFEILARNIARLAGPARVKRPRLWFAILAILLAAADAGAADAPEPGRFLLVFETSSALKKNLPVVEHELDALFAGNFQNEILENDDLAVWIVDQDLHTGAFPMASWSPAEAEIYSARLKDFLRKQNFARRASLAALQPLLNRVVKNSDRLTILIFCDHQ